MVDVDFNSQIIPLNKGVPIPSPINWPVQDGSSYDDTSGTIKSAFYNVSQNPRIITIDSTASGKSINCYEIHDAPEATTSNQSGLSVYEVKNISWTGFGQNTNSVLNRLYPYNNTLESYLSTSAATKGNRICLEGQGALTSIMNGNNLDTNNDYFVIINADDPLNHHIAKITEIHEYEVIGDGFDFEPAYNKEVPLNTKIAIYKGPASTDTHIVAVGYGLMGDTTSSDNRHDKFVEVSRPTFYFYDDRCDVDKLIANKKYMVIKNQAYLDSSTLTFDFGLRQSNPYSYFDETNPELHKYGSAICFKTEPAYGNFIEDKSRYSQYTLLKDNLKIEDDKITEVAGVMQQPIVSKGATSTWDSNDFTTLTNISLGEWLGCFYNMNRDNHHANGQSLERYETTISRYITYEDSEEKNNIVPQISYINTSKSIVDIGNYTEVKMPDPNKILNLKMKPFDKFNIKEEIVFDDYSGRMNIPLIGTVSSSTTGWSLTFKGLDVNQDLRTIWGSSPTAGLNPDGVGHSDNLNKLRVGDNVFVGDFNSAPTISTTDGYEQVFTITHRRNLLSEYVWTTCTGDWDLKQIENEKAHVYTYNSKSNLFIVGDTFDNVIDTIFDGTNLIRNGFIISTSDSFLNKTELLIRDKELTGLRAGIQYGDKHLNYLRPTNTNYDSYQITTRVGRVSGASNALSVVNIPNLFDYINGDVVFENKIFEGNIELIEDVVEAGALSYTITGRDDITKLLDIPLNENFTHTNDYVYSTTNVINEFVTNSFEIKDFDIGQTTVNIFTSSETDSPVVAGDILFCDINGKCRLVGIVSSVAVSNNPTGTYWTGSTHGDIPSSQYGYELTLTEETIYSSFNKTYGANNLRVAKKSIGLGKAISSNLSDSTRPTSLEGCSNKGVLFTSGDQINIVTGAKEELLVDLSINDSQYSRGYPISNIRGNHISSNLSDFRFNLMSDIAETTIASKDTINSVTEMAVVSVESLENKLSLITVAPIFPVVLAKTAENTSDTRQSNSQGIYFANTQGLSNGGFLHYLDSETTNTGASKTFTNPGYIDITTAADGIDYRLEDNYGTFIWRYTGLQSSEGSLLWDNSYIDRVWNYKNRDTTRELNDMYSSEGSTSTLGYASAVRVEYDGTVRDWDYQGQITDFWLQQNSPEGREGFYNIEGSRFWDIVKMPTDIKEQVVRTGTVVETFAFKIHPLRSYYPKLSIRTGFRTLSNFNSVIFRYRRNFEAFDYNIENFYLFSTGDLYPDSYKRTNSIGFTNRNLSDYSIIFKTKGVKSNSTVSHSNYYGSISDNLESDTSFEIMPIHTSDKNTSELKRFGLARLIEVTYDWHFNEVDYENLPEMTKNKHRGYSNYSALGDVTEHAPDAYDLSKADDGNPRVTGFGLEDKTSGGGGINDDGNFVTPYFIVAESPAISGLLDLRYLYTDFEAFNTGGTPSVFGTYQPQLIGRGATQDVYGTTNSGAQTFNGGAWFEVTGILNGELSGSVTQQPVGGTIGTYTNVATTTDNTNRARGFTCDITLDSATNVSNVIFHSVPSTVYTGVDIKFRGAYYEVGDIVTIAGSAVGSSQDIQITIQASDIITENRVYLNVESSTGVNIENNISGTTTKRRNYTGLLKILNVMNSLSSTTAYNKEHYTNNGEYRYNGMAGNQYADRNSGFYFFNYTTILGDRRNARWMGYYEDTNFATQTEPEKLAGNHLLLPFHIRGGDPAITNVFDGPADSSTLHNSFVNYDNTFEYSRVITQLAGWNDTNADATTSPIGHAPTHLYTDMIGIFKTLKSSNQSRIGYVEFDTGSRKDSLVEEKYSGCTIPNLHIGYVYSDGNTKFYSLRYAFNFEVSGNWGDRKTYSFTNASSNTNPNDVPIDDFRFLSSGNTNFTFNYADTTVTESTGDDTLETNTEVLLEQSDQTYAGELFFKPVLNMLATNVSVIELDEATQTTGISQATMLKSNSRTNGRVIIKIDEEDITTNANSGKASNTTIGSFPRINQWIKYVNDLTGHYLVSEQNRGSSTDSINQTVDSDRNYVQESTPFNIHQIISHNINHTGTTVSHYLEIDNVTYSGGDHDMSFMYRVMRIAKDCMFDFTPNEIELNKLTNRFTRMPSENKCYSEIGNSNIYPMQGYVSTNRTASNEAVLSMYVALDVDGKPNDDYVVRRSLNSIATDSGTNNSFINDTAYFCLLTDGINDYSKDILFTKNKTDNNYIRFSGQMKHMKGIVSIGETFSLTTFRSPSTALTKRCNIGSGVDIVEEVDEIVNQLFELNNIQYTKSYDNDIDSYFIGGSYIGANAFYTISELLKYKNKRLFIDGRELKSIDNQPISFNTNIKLSEFDSDTQISNIKRKASTFDFYNEIVVYGDNVKATSRNRKSIKERGRKITKEITDLSIKTVKAAEDKALRELNVVEALESQISFNIPKSKIYYLKPGHIISLEYPSQNVPLNYYQVLEIEKPFGQLPKVTVGKYSSNMASRFADLTLKNAELDGQIRGDRYSSKTSPLTEALEPMVKPLKLKITKSITTLGANTTIGFNNLIGFNSNIGFVATTLASPEVILDEDLTEK